MVSRTHTTLLNSATSLSQSPIFCSSQSRICQQRVAGRSLLTIEQNGNTWDACAPFAVEAAARSKTERTEPGRHWVWQPCFHNLDTADIMFKTCTLSRHVQHIHHHELAHQVRNSFDVCVGQLLKRYRTDSGNVRFEIQILEGRRHETFLPDGEHCNRHY